MDSEYNGWTNYETWLVALWLDNDEGSYNSWTERAQEIYDDAEKGDNFSKEEQAILDLSKFLQDEIEEGSPAGITGLYADLMTGALGKVDWYEMASHYIENVEKESEETGDENKN